MSSKPHSEGAKRLIEIVREDRKLRREALALGKAIKRLKEVEDQLHALNKEFVDLLVSMDCESTGNAGWQGRTGWLIGEIIRQMEAEGVDEEALKALEESMRAR